MTIAFRAAAQVVNSVASTSVVVPVPATAGGDVMVAFIARLTSGTILTPAGWTLVGTQTSTAITMSCFYRVVSSAEPASYTFTLGTSQISWGSISSYSGVDRFTPLLTSGVRVFTSSSTTFQLTPFLTGSAGGMTISAVAATRTASGVATTWTESGSERVDLSTNLGAGTDLSGAAQDNLGPNSVFQYGPIFLASQTQAAAVVWGLILTPYWPLPSPGAQVTTIVEAAIGADLTADPTTWVWTDVTSRNEGAVTITRGRADESSQTQSAKATMRLNNVDGWLTPRHPASPWYLLWGRGTPMRVKVVLPGGTYIRHQGRVALIKPVWPADNDHVAYVNVEVYGALRSLGQGNTPIHSALYRQVTRNLPLSYWPCEDGSGATALAEALGGLPMTLLGDTPTVGSGGPAGSAPLMTLAANTQFGGSVRATTNTTAWSVEFYVKIPSAPTLNTPIIEWSCAGSWPQWRFTIFPGTSTVGIEAWNTTGGTISGFTAAPTPLYGTNWMVTVAAQQSGGNIQYEFGINSTDPASGGGGHTGGSVVGTIGAIGRMYLPVGNSWARSGWVYGHISAWDRAIDVSFGLADFANWLAMGGNVGATAASRLDIMAGIAGVPLTFVPQPNSLVTSTSGTIPMGSEPLATLLAVMRDCETTDMGILSDGLDAGIRYLCRPDRYNMPVAMALDATQGHVKIPFEPIEDDQRLRDNITASRTGGGSSRVVDLATQKAQGEYDDQVSVNPADDSWLPHEAAVRVKLGTVPEMRVPGLDIDLRDQPELMQPWVTLMDLGMRYTAVNLPAQYPPGGLDQVLEQYTEVLDAMMWRVTLVGSPFAPWRAWKIGDQVWGRLDTAGAQLAAGVAAGATSLSVATTSGPLWITTAGRPQNFPFSVDVAGWQVIVTGIAGSSSPQTFTVLPVPAALAVNAPVRLYRAAALAM